MNLSLAVLSLLGALIGSESVNELLEIIRTPDFDSLLFYARWTEVRRRPEIRDRVGKKNKHFRPTFIFQVSAIMSSLPL